MFSSQTLNSNDPSLKSLLDKVPIVTAPWLSQADTSYTLIPTHIKQLRTTAPKDMKAAKETRNKERAQAKQRRRLKLKAEGDKNSSTKCEVTLSYALVSSILTLYQAIPRRT
jgi:hypothetical protein